MTIIQAAIVNPAPFNFTRTLMRFGLPLWWITRPVCKMQKIKIYGSSKRSARQLHFFCFTWKNKRLPFVLRWTASASSLTASILFPCPQQLAASGWAAPLRQSNPLESNASPVGWHLISLNIAVPFKELRITLYHTQYFFKNGCFGQNFINLLLEHNKVINCLIVYKGSWIDRIDSEFEMDISCDVTHCHSWNLLENYSLIFRSFLVFIFRFRKPC